MKKKLLLVLGLSMLLTTAYAQLNRLADQIVQKTTSLQSAVDDYEHGQGGQRGERQIRREIEDIKGVLDRLKGAIDQGGHQPPTPIQITASCSLDVGGNFFTPKSKISCTINGRGAVSYEIQVGSSIEWQGVLNPQQISQAFATDKKKVGGHAVTYQVFVRTQFGGRILVSTLR